MPQCGIVALDCCSVLFVVCLIFCYNIFKRSFFCSCATKPTPKIYEYMLTYTHIIRARNTLVLTLFFHFWEYANLASCEQVTKGVVYLFIFLVAEACQIFGLPIFEILIYQIRNFGVSCADFYHYQNALL